MSASSGTSSWAVPTAIPPQAVEELRVPILLTPGNHDYRKNHYRLVFNINEVHTDITRVRNFSNLGITRRKRRRWGTSSTSGSKPGPEPRSRPRHGDDRG